MAEPIIIGSDWDCVLKGAQDSGSGEFLNSATVVYTLYTEAGVAVPGGSDTCGYVAASDGTYLGVIEDTVTATLTAGAQYYIQYVLVQGSTNFTFREWTTAQAPGPGIVDSVIWQESTGLTVTGADLASIRRFCSAVTDALNRRCYPNLLTPRTITLFAFDAPRSQELYVPCPIRSISALYYHSGANGDASVINTTADLFVAGRDYDASPDDVLTGYNRSGLIMRANRSIWGISYVRYPDNLAFATRNERRSVFVSASLGPAFVSPLVQEAAVFAVTLLYQRRKTGMPLQSESFGGYSYSGAGQFTAEAAVNSPEVTESLRAAGVLPIHVAG